MKPKAFPIRKVEQPASSGSRQRSLKCGIAGLGGADVAAKHAWDVRIPAAD